MTKSPNNAFLPGHNNVSFSSNVVNLISGCVNALHADFRSIDILYKLKSVLIVEVEQYSANRFRHNYSSMKFEQFVQNTIYLPVNNVKKFHPNEFRLHHFRYSLLGPYEESDNN